MIQMVLISSTVWGAINAYLARRRGKNPYQWFLFGFLFGAIGFGFLMFAPKKAVKKETPKVPEIKPNPLTYWYYLKGEERFGPMSFDALKKAFIADKIENTSLVWNEEMEDWQELSQIPLYDQIST